MRPPIDPILKHTPSEQAGWSDKIHADDATARGYFPPEDMKTRVSLDTIADAIKTAKHSVLVCALDLTDAASLVYPSCCAKSQVVQMSCANCRRTAFGTILHRSAC